MRKTVSILCLGLLGLLAISGTEAAAQTEAKPVHFVRDVVPTLTKLGCNAGACHGSFQGRGGLRLSLLGFDPQVDFDALVNEARGRRILPAIPDLSMLLRKPSGQMAHGGGRRLDTVSPSYRVLRDWIIQGARGQGLQDVRVVRIEISPAEAVLQPKQKIALEVRAVWSDGVAQDATAWALFDTTNDRVAEVQGSGAVTAQGPGRTAITVRYMGQVGAVAVTVPFADRTEAPAFPSNNYIDGHIAAEWKKLALRPAALADDYEFVRRLYLDLIGTLPSPAEIHRFVQSKDPAKRDQLIDELLERSEYVDYWSIKWGDLLRAHNRALGEKGLKSFSVWLKQNLRDNRGVDRVVRELLLAQGNLYASGPVAFYFVDQTPEDLGETTAQIFLGVRMQCAKCHHHPFEVWSQEDYYGLASFFTRVERKDTKEGGRFGGAQSIRLKATGRIEHPKTLRDMPPGLPGQGPLKIAETDDPRKPLADWITARDNPFFARNIVNRYWGYLFGRGLVEPIDDLRATNPASHPALLDALAKDFVEHGYDLKHLLRTMCRSRTYQLASELAPERDADGMFCTHRRPRRLSAEVMLDAVNQATGTEETFTGLPLGTRAIGLPDSSVVSAFLDTFGRPKRASTCECERGEKPDLGQVLHLVNSEKIQLKIAHPQGRLAKLLAAGKKDDEIVEDFYLATFSRPPTAAERKTVARLLSEAPSRREGLEDLLWTLLNSGPFVFNH